MQKEGVPVEDQHITLQLPTMYGDHHTSKVRQILTALPGVKHVSASSAQQKVQVAFDPAQTSTDAIRSALAVSGFPPGELPGMLNPPLDELRHVTASDRAERAPEAKYAPPAKFGACPGLEPKVVGGEHPADRK